MIKRIVKLYNDSGFVLFFIRLPFRGVKFFLDIINTLFYRVVCNKVGENVRIEFGVKIESPKLVSIGSNVFIGKGTLIVSENDTGKFVLSDAVHIGRHCHLDHTGGLYIDKDTLLSESVTLYSHSHGYDPRSKAVGIKKVIASGCWIGSRAIVLETSECLTNKSIVASGAVLTKSILEPNSIYAGVPAKKIKSYND
jgi:acetyltransferase-like isoleucine patch superfamily enzyme